ncbi:MAG: hypothetical protein JWQ19_615 [Subtercola sp.]|nr:hypothetical protein [Subtercola sp.]
MIEIPTGLPPEIVPLSWLLGVWEGTGVIDYTIGDEKVSHEFGQRVSFSQDGLPYLNYSSYAWLLDEKQTPLVTEMGYWRLSRPSVEGDPGPGMLPGADPRPFASTEAVEGLRNADEGFDIEVSLLHPGGVDELYIGQVKAARIDLATDAVMRSHSAKEYSAATRIYGLVQGHLLWAWDIAALGQDLRTHASARLARVD